MNAIPVQPQATPPTLVGDLDVVDSPTNYLYLKDDHDDDRDRIRTEIHRLGLYHQPDRTLPVLHRAVDDRNANYNRQFGERTAYFNYTDEPVVVVNRLGIPEMLVPESRSFEHPYKAVVIRKEYFFDNGEVVTRTLATLRAIAPIQGQDLSSLQKLLYRDQGSVSRNGCRVVFEYVVREEEFQNPTRSVYHYKADVVLSQAASAEVPRHPFSAEATLVHGGVFQATPQTDEDLGLIVRYVTSKFKAQPKYMRFANKVLKLVPQRDHPARLMTQAPKDKRGEVQEIPELDEYIEFIYAARIDTDSPKNKGFRCVRLPLDEAQQQYGIFDQLQDIVQPTEAMEAALRLLKEKLALTEIELKKAQREASEKLTVADREHATERHNLEADLARRDEQIFELKKDQAARIEQLKERREGQAHQQRMGFEIAKFCMTMLATLIGMIPVLIKLRQLNEAK